MAAEVFPLFHRAAVGQAAEAVFGTVFVCFDFRFSTLFDAEFGGGVGDADSRAFLSGLVGEQAARAAVESKRARCFMDFPF